MTRQWSSRRWARGVGDGGAVGGDGGCGCHWRPWPASRHVKVGAWEGEKSGALEREEERGRAGRGRRGEGKRRRALRKEAGSINDINQQHLRPPARLRSADRRAEEHSPCSGPQPGPCAEQRRRCAHASLPKTDLTPTGAALPLDYPHPRCFRGRLQLQIHPHESTRRQRRRSTSCQGNRARTPSRI